MTALLGNARETQRILWFRIFIDVVNGETIKAVSKKYGKAPSGVQFRTQQMSYYLYRAIYEEPDFPLPEIKGKRYPTLEEVREKPDYWIQKLFEYQDKVACNNTDRNLVWENKPLLRQKLTPESLK